MNEEQDNAPGFISGLFDGLLSSMAPQAYAYNKKKALMDYERQLIETDIGKTVQMSQEAVDAETDPIRKMQKQSIQSYARMLTPMTADKAGDTISGIFKNISRGDAPTDLAKNAGFIYNDNIPPEVREAARQKFMNDRAYDNRTLDIKQQNADASTANVKNKSMLNVAGAGGAGGAGGAKVQLNKDQVLNPDGTVSTLPGSIAHKKQIADYTEDANTVASKLQLYDTVGQSVDSLLNDKNLKSQYGKGDLISGLVAQGTRYLSPDTKAQIDQLNEQLKTLGGASYKSVAGSAGSMQVKEWDIFQKQIAVLSDPNISLEKAKEALKSVKEYVNRRGTELKSLHENQYGREEFYKPDTTSNGTELPLAVRRAFTVKRNGYRMLPDGTARQNIATGALEAMDNGKWIPAGLETAEDGSGYYLYVDKPEAGVESETVPAKEESIDDLVNKYKSN
jgi:DNA-binding ferritin-like protein